MWTVTEQDWWNIGKAIGYFFLNPLFWVALIAAVGLGYFRVKRERKHFNIRLLPGLTEWRRIVSESWLPALVLSIVVSGVGLTVDRGWLVLFIAISLAALLFFYYQAMSPVYFAAIAALAIYGMQFDPSRFALYGWNPDQVDLSGWLAVTVAIIAGLLLISEGYLIRRFAVRYSSPLLEPTNRGLEAAVFKVKRLWLLPVVFLVPGDMLSAHLPYWPQLSLGAATFSFVPVPVIIGFSQIVRTSFPEIVFPKMGRAILAIGVVVVAIGIGAIWMPVLGWAALCIGVLCRIILSIVTAVKERKGIYVAAPRSAGVMIAGVLPESPGERLGLLPGECIRAVNGIQVTNEKELYDAIQVNAAHCRLQVIGRDGEVRLMQQVLYRHDHHRLGLLVVR
ncbi:hypothetical protein HNO89_001716 [Sporosarcina luteola]|nr:hypothetical protein [Sporosarcina luteola]